MQPISFKQMFARTEAKDEEAVGMAIFLSGMSEA
jgi:hypothetical protein